MGEPKYTLKPVAYRHSIVEPDGQEQICFSVSPDNPWSHWVAKHRDKCTYTVMPLYAEAPEMFDALAKAREFVLRAGRPETNDRHHELYQTIEAALLKAQGQQTEVSDVHR